MLKKIIIFVFAIAVSLQCAAQYKRYHGDGIDDYLRFVPITAAYVMKAAGVKSQSPWKRLLVNTATSFAVDAPPLVPFGSHVVRLLRSGGARQGVPPHKPVDKRGRICRGHSNSRRPRAPEPPPLERRSGWCGHRMAVGPGRLLAWRQDYRMAEKRRHSRVPARLKHDMAPVNAATGQPTEKQPDAERM